MSGDGMTWTLGLTDGQYYWLCCALVAVVVVTGALMVGDLRRRLRRAGVRACRAHPANRRPYDWAVDDPGRRQASCVRKVAS